MSILTRISAILGLRNAARNPGLSQPRRKKKQKKTIKGGRFARTVIRFQQRQHRRYVPGQLGLSSVSIAISSHYDGQILSRRERKKLASKSIHPRPIFYGGY